MKKTYQQPTTETFRIRAEYHLCSGSPKVYELVRYGNVYDNHGNPAWVDEGNWPSTPIKDYTKEGGTAIDIGLIGDQLDSRSKGSLWDDDDY